MRRLAASSLLGGTLAALLAISSSVHGDVPKRDLPDYDGTGEPPATPGGGATIALRVLLSPVYLVTEYLLRRPLGALIAGAERSGLPEVLYDFFAFGPDHKAGIIPIFYIDFGFRPTFGLYAFWNDAFVPRHDLRLRGTVGPDTLVLGFGDRVRLSSDPYDRIVVEGDASRRPDYKYYGLGPSSLQSARLLFGADILEARTGADGRLWRSSSIHGRVGVRSLDFRRGGIHGQALLEDAVAAGTVPPPPGYPNTHHLGFVSMSGAFDTRQKNAPDGSGIRVEVDGAYTSDLQYSGQSWVGWGGAAGVFIDVTGTHRVVSLSANTHFVDPVSDATIPFTELVSLGGNHPMRGYVTGRLRDRSAVVWELGYRWPVWIWLDGSMRFEVGNVFGPGLGGFDPGLLRFSGSIGVESTGSPDNSLQILFGVGSETFASGGKIDSFRVLLGTTHGF